MIAPIIKGISFTSGCHFPKRTRPLSNAEEVPWKCQVPQLILAKILSNNIQRNPARKTTTPIAWTIVQSINIKADAEYIAPSTPALKL